MTGKVEKWKALPDEEKQKVLDAFKRRIDNLVYSDICKSYERYQEVGGNYDTPALKAHSFRGGMKTQTDASR